MLLVPCVTEQISFTGLIFEVSESLNGFIFRPFNCGRSLLSCLKGVVFAAAPLGLHMLFRMWAFFLRCRIIVLYQRWHWFIALPVSTSGWKGDSWLRFILQMWLQKKHRKHQCVCFFLFVQLKMMLHVNARISADTTVEELSLTLEHLYLYLNSNLLLIFLSQFEQGLEYRHLLPWSSKWPSFGDKMGRICNFWSEKLNFTASKPVIREMEEMSGHVFRPR